MLAEAFQWGVQHVIVFAARSAVLHNERGPVLTFYSQFNHMMKKWREKNTNAMLGIVVFWKLFFQTNNWCHQVWTFLQPSCDDKKKKKKEEKTHSAAILQQVHHNL